MIHYDELAKRLGKLKPGENLILKVDGMLSPGKDRDGEPKLPAVENGALVKVLKVDVDSVQVQTVAGKKVVFSHSVGARKLELTAHADFPKDGSATGQEEPKK